MQFANNNKSNGQEITFNYKDSPELEFTSIKSRCKYSVDIAYYTPVFDLAGGSIIRYKTFNSEFRANYTGDVLTITAGINYYRNDQLYATQSPHALGIALLGYQFDGFEIYALWPKSDEQALCLLSNPSPLHPHQLRSEPAQ